MTTTAQKNSTLQNYKGPIILIIFCILGAILGLVLGDKAAVLKPIGQIFLNLLFCLIVPLIFFSIAGSIANMKDTGKVGKMIGYTLIIFIITATLSALLILLVTHFTGVPTSFTASKPAQMGKVLPIGDQIVNTLTVGDFPQLISRMHVLPLIILTIFFGLCVSMIGDKAKPVVDWLNSMTLVCYKMVNILMKAAPIGLGAYFADLTGTYGIALLKTYGSAMIVFYAVVFFYFFVFLGFYAYLAAGTWGVKNFFKVILAPALTALGTRSSAATIPLQLEACDKLGVPKEISSVVIAMGATCHMDGACIAMVYAEVLATTIFGRPIVGMEYLLAIFVGVTSSVATSSIPGGGAAGETMIMSVFHLPEPAFPILLMVIELFDPGCTLLNSCGDTVVSMMISRIFYGKDWYKKQQTVSSAPDAAL
jgi:Na+/H+-dicarboxylate symporter